ncbi:hypothetical protein Q8A67_021517 [Cirrhinus molitorella]|uniref:Uncharacterized protein n=1 Tax=Cirrhinus molitorella TaxID=172907 RepID=A0AA88P3R1_9TELE|nr:hypothetical protein Q8A67_021517 [Cirrhinus molitorella]
MPRSSVHQVLARVAHTYTSNCKAAGSSHHSSCLLLLVLQTREEGGTRCQKKPSLLSGIAVLRRSVVLEQWKRWDGRLAAVLLVRGGVVATREGAEEFDVCQEAGACFRLPCLGRSREQGLDDGCPQTGEAIAIRQEVEEHRAIHQKRSSTIAWHLILATALVVFVYDNGVYA